MRATLKLLNSYFWKTIYGPILAFVFPIILLGILGNVLRLEYVYPGLIALSMMFLGVIALPLAIMELKGSSLFKYIGSSPVNPLKFTIVVIGFYTFIAIITGIIIFFATMAIFPTKVFPKSGFKYGVIGGIFSLKGSFSFYAACLIHLMFVVVTGLAIATFAKTPQQALTIGLIIILPSMFLSGMVLSVDVIAESDVMNWISRFIPYRYSTGNIVVSATPIDQLDSAIQYWMNQPYDLAFSANELLPRNQWPNNFIDQIVWPYIDDPSWPTSLNPDGPHGYNAWIQNGMPDVGTLNTKPNFDTTLFNLLANHWSAMELMSDNNMFNWLNDWGARKIPSVDVLTGFVTKYFQGVDGNGNALSTSSNTSTITDRVAAIYEQIKNGDFRFMELFTHQSNVLYYQVDRVLNTIVPVGLASLSSWYIYRNFNWSSR